ncbi:LCP family protein [Agrococcus casei]|uniref:Cell envelope-associated transcriptional attenuator LytR-CpsA-Psr, subfamily A1 (As in PMID19099556) n=1 Tax=Agrococcus casei LMG 22410 TaxID=1255656 RepID=A0A1R4G8P2_9MICO|nr:LCP family protein [Agrococcus casei]SJM64526.1 Cell envelope-associated transcriptional attenuator LytR-CpsA-Psr, subfamily A1 (as in PMID19099556) [Agrococcus casei LMG 22410]
MGTERIVDASGVAPRHGKLKRHHPMRSALGYIAMAMAIVLVATIGTAGITVWQLTSRIDTVDIADGETVTPPEFANQKGAFNVLLVGSDTREGQDATNDSHDGPELNDVTMLLHVHEDHQGATVISFPRDLILDFPACPSVEEGEPDVPEQYGAQFNTALATGGLGCVAHVVESITGLEIPYAAKITFDGVINMSTAVGGVPVCFSGAVQDPWSGLDIPEAGTYELEGEQALQFLRTRHGVGDGSDLSRIASQRVFLSALLRKAQSDEVLGNLSSLYNIAQVATENMQLSTSLNDLGTIVGMANVMRKIPLDTMQFVTYPTVPLDQRVAPDFYTAEIMMELVRNDEPIPLDPDDLGGGADDGETGTSDEPVDPTDTEAPADPTDPTDPATEDPTQTDPNSIDGMVDGQNAEQETCVVPYGFVEEPVGGF